MLLPFLDAVALPLSDVPVAVALTITVLLLTVNVRLLIGYRLFGFCQANFYRLFLLFVMLAHHLASRRAHQRDACTHFLTLPPTLNPRRRSKSYIFPRQTSRWRAPA
jgi:hypothetical protein